MRPIRDWVTGLWPISDDFSRKKKYSLSSFLSALSGMRCTWMKVGSAGEKMWRNIRGTKTICGIICWRSAFPDFLKHMQCPETFCGSNMFGALFKSFVGRLRELFQSPTNHLEAEQDTYHLTIWSCTDLFAWRSLSPKYGKWQSLFPWSRHRLLHTARHLNRRENIEGDSLTLTLVQHHPWHQHQFVSNMSGLLPKRRGCTKQPHICFIYTHIWRYCAQ